MTANIFANTFVAALGDVKVELLCYLKAVGNEHDKCVRPFNDPALIRFVNQYRTGIRSDSCMTGVTQPLYRLQMTTYYKG